MNNFDGYHEPIHNTQARAWRIALASAGYAPQFCAENEADKLRKVIFFIDNSIPHNNIPDPRTGEQADIDRWQDETETTRRSDYPI